MSYGNIYNILIDLLRNMSLLAITAYLLGQSRVFRRLVYAAGGRTRFVALTLIFGIMSMVGTNTAVPVNGALANTRLAGAVVGGLLGGPAVGAAAGFIGGLHRWLLGGFTGLPCGLATVFGGLLGGLVYRRYSLQGISWRTALGTALVAEILQKGLVLLLAKPWSAAVALEQVIALPTTAVTAFGTTVFITIFYNIKRQQELYGANAADMALAIASRTLPHLRQGLNRVSAQATARIIAEITGIDAVSITSCTEILGFVGLGDDHHRPGTPILTQATKRALATGDIVVAQNRQERGCRYADCQLQSCVVAPLTQNGAVVGAVKLSHAQPNSVTAMDIKLADGLAHLLSVQLELAEMDAQVKMRQKAEFRALQSQINPHFLFNTLTVIMSCCRTKPALARDLLGHLSGILRRTMQQKDDFVTLAEELTAVRSYLEIEKVRFGDRLHVALSVDESLLAVRVPVLTLQPLVENALRHGLFPKIGPCRLDIAASRQGRDMVVVVQDNGLGIPPDKLQHIFDFTGERIGIPNVHQRLRHIYGEGYGLRIDSQVNGGTRVRFAIPLAAEKLVS